MQENFRLENTVLQPEEGVPACLLLKLGELLIQSQQTHFHMVLRLNVSTMLTWCPGTYIRSPCARDAEISERCRERWVDRTSVGEPAALPNKQRVEPVECKVECSGHVLDQQVCKSQ